MLPTCLKIANDLRDMQKEEGHEPGPTEADVDVDVSDFDRMLARKRAARGSNRKHKDAEIIDDSDDVIEDLIQKMMSAYEQDYECHKNRQTATRKMLLLPTVVATTHKYSVAKLVEHNFLDVLSKWLAPLADGSLPALKIRQEILTMLASFSSLDEATLTQSSIGKAVSYLRNHAKETKANKIKADQMRVEWTRTMFNITTDIKAFTRQDRQQWDSEQHGKEGRKRPFLSDCHTPKQDQDSELVFRARVPQPSMKDYVVRPKWTIDTDISQPPKKLSRMEKLLRNFKKSSRPPI